MVPWPNPSKYLKKQRLGPIELRVEFFNLFNRINIGIPGTTVDQGDAGRVTTIAPGTAPR